MPTFQNTQRSESAKLLQYGQSLFDLRRYKDAESTLRQALAHDPQSFLGHYFLGCALLAQSDDKPEKAREGLSEAKRAIALRPDSEDGYFLLAWAHLCLARPKDALDAAHHGMRINPQEAWGYSLVGQAYRMQRLWSKELEAAGAGLKIAPDHSTLLNLYAEALIMLERKDEARQAVEMALRADPSSPKAHANRGWLALYQGDEKEALRCFREAMRLDPTSEASRQGLVQALHARSPLYKLMQWYYLWTQRVTTGDFWTLIVILNGINTTLRVVSKAFPPLLIITIPYFALFQVFTFFTWTGDAFFTLLLRLSPTGRQVLTKDEKNEANGCGFTALLFLINLIAFIAALILRPGEPGLLWTFALGALLSFGMMIPTAGIFKVDPSYRKRRGALVVIAAMLGATAACAWGGSFSLQPWHGVAIFLFLVGWMIYPWAANLIISIQD